MIIMNTKKFYMAPTMNVVEIESVGLLAGSGTNLGAGGSIPGRDDGGDVGDEWTN